MKDRFEKYLERRKSYFDRVAPPESPRLPEGLERGRGHGLATGKMFPHSFQPVDVVNAAAPEKSFRFAYISDSHLYEKTLNERFVRAILKAVDDVNAMNPQPDFVLYGGDLAQLGQPGEIAEGAQILKALKAPVKMMVGEHDWYLDMGEEWRKRFGKDIYSFDHKGVHFVVLNSVIVEDYWTAPKMTPMDRMLAMAQLDNPNGRPFTVGEAQRDWLKNDLAKVKPDTPIIVFSHSPLYKIYKPWNFWTDDAEQVQADPGPLQDRDRHPRPHPPDADQPHRQHPLPRHALDGLAVALRAPGPAQADRAHEPRRSVRRVRRLRRRLDRRPARRARQQGLQPLEPQSGHGDGRLPRLGRGRRARRRARPTSTTREDTMASSARGLWVLAAAPVAALALAGSPDERPQERSGRDGLAVRRREPDDGAGPQARRGAGPGRGAPGRGGR